MSKKEFNTISAVVLLFLAVLAGSASGATFTASLDRDTISLGEQATLSLKFDGVQPQNEPALPAVNGLQFQYVGPSSSFSFINGQTSSSVTYNYIVVAHGAGEFTIPALTANVNGRQLTSQPLKLIVTKPNAPNAASINSGNEVAFMKLTVPDKKIYAGETLVAQLQIFVRDDVQNFGNFQPTSTPADGFVIGKTAQAGRSRTQIGDHLYNVVPISVALTATRAGNLSLGPFTANMVVVLPGQNGGGDLISQFFNQGEQKQVSLATDEVKIQSLPLPTENVPTNFNGAIGDFTMNVNAGPTNVAAGDPITVRVQISGRGSLDSLKLSDQSGWNDFKIFSPTQKTDFSDQLGLQGTKTFEEIVTPQNTDVHALPEFSFSFFNPNDGKYHTLTQPPEQLIVRAGGAAPLPAIAATKNSEQQNQTPRDILPIKNDLGTLAQIPVGRDSVEPLISNPIFLGAQSLPVLAFLGALIWRKRADNLVNNPRLRRQRAVAQLVQIGIGDLKKFASENNSEQFFAALFRLLQEQLGERLDCPATSITENVIEENSILRAAPDAMRNDLRELFQLCNQARYAPVRGTAELNSVAAQFEKTVGELQEVKV